MNGPQHYAEAERLLDGVEYDDGPERAQAAASAAQAHATLALVALMSETQIGPQSAWDDIRSAWSQAVWKS